jgi:hypothetical protein
MCAEKKQIYETELETDLTFVGRSLAAGFQREKAG